MTSMRCVWGVCLATLLVCVTGHAKASPGQFQLTWSGGSNCPDRIEVERRVERILNRPLEVREDEHLIVTAAVRESESDKPWRVELEIDNGRRHATRSLQAASCDELANATALVIAILLEPNVQGATALDNDAPPAPDPAAPPIESSSTQDRTRAPNERDLTTREFRVGVGAFAGVISAALPTWSGGLGIDALLGWRALQAHISGVYYFPVEQRAADNANQGARFRLISTQAELELCLTIFGRLCAGPSSGAQLAFLQGEGFGPGVVTNTQDARFIAFSAGGLVAWEAAPNWTVRFDADALFPLGDRRFVFTGTDPTLLHTPGWGAQLALGVQYFFGGADLHASGPY